ncbi:uncharacterized protein LOC126986121 isoform X2 [Eriocheir sinensis]|uniref:uncharacterized protein LOC126986121 isoform X2 n=1 Tax=Eriocheir sinensis TaxID=95602 RepID=UPI0021CA327B|nr:uncharacterized protein LOC126986121 isoform X2 [Eriocheir sinensis]
MTKTTRLTHTYVKNSLGILCPAIIKTTRYIRNYRRLEYVFLRHLCFPRSQRRLTGFSWVLDTRRRVENKITQYIRNYQRLEYVFLGRLCLPLRLFPKVTEKVNRVFMGEFPVPGAEVGSNYHQGHTITRVTKQRSGQTIARVTKQKSGHTITRVTKQRSGQTITRVTKQVGSNYHQGHKTEVGSNYHQGHKTEVGSNYHRGHKTSRVKLSPRSQNRSRVKLSPGSQIRGRVKLSPGSQNKSGQTITRVTKQKSGQTITMVTKQVGSNYHQGHKTGRVKLSPGSQNRSRVKLSPGSQNSPVKTPGTSTTRVFFKGRTEVTRLYEYRPECLRNISSPSQNNRPSHFAAISRFLSTSTFQHVMPIFVQLPWSFRG